MKKISLGAALGYGRCPGNGFASRHVRKLRGFSQMNREVPLKDYPFLSRLWPTTLRGKLDLHSGMSWGALLLFFYFFCDCNCLPVQDRENLDKFFVDPVFRRRARIPLLPGDLRVPGREPRIPHGGGRWNVGRPLMGALRHDSTPGRHFHVPTLQEVYGK